MTTKIDCLPLLNYIKEYGPIPDDYVSIDIEASGLGERDLPLQIGWCIVKNRKPIVEVSHVIDWTSYLKSNEVEDLAKRMDDTRKKMDSKGYSYPWTIKMLKTRGKHPKEVAKKLFETIDNQYLVAHYGWMFDYPVIGKYLSKYGNYNFSPDQSLLLDTGILVKSMLVSVSPSKGEPYHTYLKRIHSINTGHKHSVTACLDIFGLNSKGVNKSATHDSGYDSWLVHLILESLREKSNVK